MLVTNRLTQTLGGFGGGFGGCGGFSADDIDLSSIFDDLFGGGMFGGVQNNAMNANNQVATHPGVVVSSPANAEELDDNNTMAFCPNCGTKNNGSKFCGNCGHKLVK